MRILVALIAVFMVSVAVAQKKPTTPSFSENDLAFCTQVQGGPNWSCKNPKTGKVVSIECKVPPKMAQKMPKKMSGAELIEVCPTAKTSLKDVIITS